MMTGRILVISGGLNPSKSHIRTSPALGTKEIVIFAPLVILATLVGTTIVRPARINRTIVEGVKRGLWQPCAQVSQRAQPSLGDVGIGVL